MEDDAPRRRRQTPADVTARRAARSLVAPVQEQIGVWQAEAVKFETISQREQSRGRLDDALKTEIEAMLSKVSRESAAFEAALLDAPETVRRHSRITDVQTVLRMLEDRLAQLLDGN